jgi:hypothetical protein
MVDIGNPHATKKVASHMLDGAAGSADSALLNTCDGWASAILLSALYPNSGK